MANKIIPISVKDEDMIKYLNEKENRSEYIRSLIKKDMDREEGLSKEAKELIINFIKENWNVVKVDERNNNLETFKDSIFDIFNK